MFSSIPRTRACFCRSTKSRHSTGKQHLCGTPIARTTPAIVRGTNQNTNGEGDPPCDPQRRMKSNIWATSRAPPRRIRDLFVKCRGVSTPCGVLTKVSAKPIVALTRARRVGSRLRPTKVRNPRGSYASLAFERERNDELGHSQRRMEAISR